MLHCGKKFTASVGDCIKVHDVSSFSFRLFFRYCFHNVKVLAAIPAPSV